MRGDIIVSRYRLGVSEDEAIAQVPRLASKHIR